MYYKGNEERGQARFRLKGVSVYGKFANILLTDSAVEVCITPVWLFVACAWLAAFAGLVVGMMFDGMIMIVLMTILTGTIGALLVWHLYIGKVAERYAYNDVVSFVLNGAEMTINMKSHKMYVLRMMPKRQQQMIEAMRQIMNEHTGFVLKQNGNYYRVYLKRELEEQEQANAK